MPQKVAPVPKGYRTATPCLIVNGVDDAIEFYTQAFNASTLKSVMDPSESVTVQATLKIGNSLVILQQESYELGILSPDSSGNSSAHIHLYVENVDSLWKTAMGAGASAISEPLNTYWGDRSGILLDPFSHRWSLASRIEHVSDEESKKRALELFPVENYSNLEAVSDIATTELNSNYEDQVIAA